MPNILALDTTTERCSVALRADGQLLSTVCNEQRRHADRVLGMINDLLTRAEIERKNLDAIAVCHGPGSFTGIRIGVAVAQGLAWALELPVVPVSSLAALALQSYRKNNSQYVLSCLDARINEVYFAAYSVNADKVTALTEQTLAAPSLVEIPHLAQPIQWFAAGNGWQFLDEFSYEIRSQISEADSQGLPHADEVLVLAERAFAKDEYCSPEELTPVYLRDNVANKPE